MAFTAFPIPTATILQHTTATTLDGTAYVLVQKTTGETQKISLAALALAVGLVPKFDDIAALEDATVTASVLILIADANGAAGIFESTESGTPDGVNIVEDEDGNLFRRIQLT